MLDYKRQVVVDQILTGFQILTDWSAETSVAFSVLLSVRFSSHACVGLCGLASSRGANT